MILLRNLVEGHCKCTSYFPSKPKNVYINLLSIHFVIDNTSYIIALIIKPYRGSTKPKRNGGMGNQS